MLFRYLLVARYLMSMFDTICSSSCLSSNDGESRILSLVCHLLPFCDKVLTIVLFASM